MNCPDVQRLRPVFDAMIRRIELLEARVRELEQNPVRAVEVRRRHGRPEHFVPHHRDQSK